MLEMHGTNIKKNYSCGLFFCNGLCC